MGFREIFFPKKRDFFKMLKDQSSKTTEGMQALYDFVLDPTPEKEKRVETLEVEADDLRRTLILELNQAFITPIDREDIFALSRAIDDMIDYGKSTVEEMLLFKVTPNEYIKKMTSALLNASKEIDSAVGLLASRPQDAAEHLIRAKKAENFVEHRYREALAELFNTDDAIQIIKMREIYRHLSNSADRGDEAADIIGDIIVKVT